MASEDESVLEQIAQYGGEQRPLFDATQAGLAKKLSIVVEGFDSGMLFFLIGNISQLIVPSRPQSSRRQARPDCNEASSRSRWMYVLTNVGKEQEGHDGVDI